MLLSLLIIYVDKYLKVDKLFGKYVSPDVAELIWKNRDKIILKGEKKIATVIFTDIRGFTTISENSDPQLILQLLNDYFETMAQIIYKNNGNLNKFIGDGLMIIFGVPLSSSTPETDAINAVKCAVEMIQEVKKLNNQWKEKYNGIDINIGVGIHTGEIIAGNIGSTKRLEYSAIGDTVNLSARLEGVNKDFNTNLILSESTYNLVKSSFNTKPLGHVKVKGRVQEVEIYTIDYKEEQP